MKIAIVSSLPNHVECLGFVLECLTNDIQNEYDITVFTLERTDHGYENYFMSIYEFELKTFKEYDGDDFDVTIKLSAHDRKILTDVNKVISIVHTCKHDDHSHRKITLSPYVKAKGEYTWMMSLYHGKAREINEQTKKIFWVGQLEDDWIDDDMINFVKRANYFFTFVISSGEGRGQPFKDRIETGEITNAEVINDMDTMTLIDRMNDCDLVLCRKIPFQKVDRYSGIITLALSHNVPIIINKQFAQDYKIPGIIFKKNYCEVIEYINAMQLNDLKEHAKIINRYTNKVCAINIAKMRKIIDAIEVDKT